MKRKSLLECVLFLVVSQGLFGGNTADELYQKAVALEKKGRYGQAAQTMNEVLAAVPGNDFYLAYASHVERLAGDYENGLRHAIAAISLNGAVGWYHASAMCNAWGCADIDATRTYARKVVSLGPTAAGKENFDYAQTLLKSLSRRVYTITWRLDPSKGVKTDGRYRVPLPTDGLPYQRARFDVEGCSERTVVVAEGNDVLLFSSAGDGVVTIRAEIAITPFSFRKRLSGHAARGDCRVPDDVAPYLGRSDRVDPNSAAVRMVAGPLKHREPMVSVRNILSWMNKNIKYEIKDFRHVDEILRRRNAECGGWSALFTALCRANGIPAREVWGVIEDPTPDRRFAPAGHLKGHAWAEFYLCGIGWVPVEPQRPDTLGFLPATYVRMYHYDVVSSLTSTHAYRPNGNMVLMNGDTPAFVVDVKE